MIKLSKLAGIYQITNKINNKKYIGKSNNIMLRWSSHISDLINSSHRNKELQEDFNELGATTFDFTILELSDNINKLSFLEQKYINTLDLNYDYNKYNATRERLNDIKGFMTYINQKWLVPSGLNDNEIERYKIYKEEDKKEILNMVVDYQLIDDAPSRITFNRVIRFMINTLGYSIENGRFRIKNKQYTYKLIVDFDEDFENQPNKDNESKGDIK